MAKRVFSAALLGCAALALAACNVTCSPDCYQSEVESGSFMMVD